MWPGCLSGGGFSAITDRLITAIGTNRTNSHLTSKSEAYQEEIFIEPRRDLFRHVHHFFTTIIHLRRCMHGDGNFHWSSLFTIYCFLHWRYSIATGMPPLCSVSSRLLGRCFSAAPHRHVAGEFASRARATVFTLSAVSLIHWTGVITFVRATIEAS